MEEFIIHKMSENALKAFEQVERLYHQWKKDDILEQIDQIQEEYGIEADYDSEKLENISEGVLREYMLVKSSWHHVNGRCTWFYVISKKAVCALCKRIIQQMTAQMDRELKRVNKPKLVSVRKNIWVEDRGRQYSKSVLKTAVVYNGNAYFADGSRIAVRDDRCVIVKECKSIVKEKRNIFEKIVRSMRMNYGIAI